MDFSHTPLCSLVSCLKLLGQFFLLHLSVSSLLHCGGSPPSAPTVCLLHFLLCSIRPSLPSWCSTVPALKPLRSHSLRPSLENVYRSSFLSTPSSCSSEETEGWIELRALETQVCWIKSSASWASVTMPPFKNLPDLSRWPNEV